MIRLLDLDRLELRLVQHFGSMGNGAGKSYEGLQTFLHLRPRQLRWVQSVPCPLVRDKVVHGDVRWIELRPLRHELLEARQLGFVFIEGDFSPTCGSFSRDEQRNLVRDGSATRASGWHKRD